MKTVAIKIIDTPAESNAIALAMRRYLLNSTPAFVWDNCGKGSAEQPRRLTAEFPKVWRETMVNLSEKEKVL